AFRIIHNLLERVHRLLDLCGRHPVVAKTAEVSFACLRIPVCNLLQFGHRNSFVRLLLLLLLLPLSFLRLLRLGFGLALRLSLLGWTGSSLAINETVPFR